MIKINKNYLAGALAGVLVAGMAMGAMVSSTVLGQIIQPRHSLHRPLGFGFFAYFLSLGYAGCVFSGALSLITLYRLSYRCPPRVRVDCTSWATFGGDTVTMAPIRTAVPS